MSTPDTPPEPEPRPQEPPTGDPDHPIREKPGKMKVDTLRPTRKVREGTVVSDAMDKTVVVAVVERVRHRKYNKFVLQTKKLYAHDEHNDARVGDKVRVMETRPLSKTKRWRLDDIVERAR